MKIAVLSGKGGTGKTTLSTNLASVYGRGFLIDTDVEEPNGHLFLNVESMREKAVYKSHPVVNLDKCDLCGDCGRFCHYNAILPAKKDVLVFNEMCHDCGGCELVCPKGAISYEKRIIGKIHLGEVSKMFKFAYGDLKVGEVSGVTIIETLRDYVEDENMVWIDSPPGTSCSTVAAIEDVDFAIIVSEPTPFGVSDMTMVVEMLREKDIDFGVVVNKAGLGDDEIYRYCKTESINILQEIPFRKDFAEKSAQGFLLCEISDEYRKMIDELLKNIIDRTSAEFKREDR
jgi:MinD superfamily P-loop ATPase